MLRAGIVGLQLIQLLPVGSGLTAECHGSADSPVEWDFMRLAMVAAAAFIDSSVRSA